MRTVCKNVYLFDELSKEAQEKAIQHFRELECEHSPYFIDDANKTFEKFAEIFGLNWSYIDYEEPYKNQYSLTFDDNILNLSGQRLATWLWNNYKNQLFQGEYYGRLVDHFADGTKIEKSKEYPAGLRHVKRNSLIVLEHSCVLTGMCYDDDILRPIYEFLEKPKENINIETLINDCIYSLCGSIQDEINYSMSDEYLTEQIRDNEYEFTDNGETNPW